MIHGVTGETSQSLSSSFENWPLGPKTVRMHIRKVGRTFAAADTPQVYPINFVITNCSASYHWGFMAISDSEGQVYPLHWPFPMRGNWILARASLSQPSYGVIE